MPHTGEYIYTYTHTHLFFHGSESCKVENWHLVIIFLVHHSMEKGRTAKRKARESESLLTLSIIALTIMVASVPFTSVDMTTSPVDIQSTSSQCIWQLRRFSLQFTDGDFSLCPHILRKVVYSLRTLNVSIRVLLSWPNHLQSHIPY